MIQLAIGNKRYSSWSLRPWLVMKHMGLPFEEIVIPLRRPGTAASIKALSPSGKVPALIDEDVTIWDSLAIIEYLHEKHPHLDIWPKESAARAHARSISAEMHSGFMALRTGCPMDIAKRFAPRDRGANLLADVARIQELWRQARTRFGAKGPFLFGDFSAADAMYAPVVTRLETYSIEVADETQNYCQAILALPAYREWRAQALAEPWEFAEAERDETIIEDYRQLA